MSLSLHFVICHYKATLLNLHLSIIYNPIARTFIVTVALSKPFRTLRLDTTGLPCQRELCFPTDAKFVRSLQHVAGTPSASTVTDEHRATSCHPT